jgi:hypothetical protein
MIGEIIGILADRERHDREYHSDTFPPDVHCEDVWGPVVGLARQRGMAVTWVQGYVQIGQGTFQDNEGGAMLAREFLGGAA